jgi:hypothetical protein
MFFGGCTPSNSRAGLAIDLRRTYPTPLLPDPVLGPLMVDCAGTAGCLALPSSLDELVGGRRLKFAQFETAGSGDYVYGTAQQIGIPAPASVADQFYSRLSAAGRDYDQWLQDEDGGKTDPAVQADMERTPPVLGDLTEAYRAEVRTYLHSLPAKACSLPLRAAARLDQDFSKPFTLTTQQNREVATLKASFVREYWQNCLTARKDRPLGEAIKRLVFFVDSDTPKGSAAFVSCSGMLVAYDLVLTARHCLVDSAKLLDFELGLRNGRLNEQQARAVRLPLEISGTRRAIVVGAPHKIFEMELGRIAFDENIEDFNPIDDVEQDYVLVRLRGINKSDFPPIAVEAPVPMESIAVPHIYAPQSELIAALSSETDDAILERDMNNKIFVDFSPFCRVIKITGQCIIHACQTEGGHSGTPLIAVTADTFQVIGVHTGVVGTVNPACGFPRGAYIPNYGIALPQLRLSLLRQDIAAAEP